MYVIILWSLSMVAQVGLARTLWSGSFVDVARNSNFVEVSVNYPRPGIGKICGIELKSSAMILHPRVWQRVADGLKVESLHPHNAAEVSAVIRNAEGPQIVYQYDNLTVDYGTLRISTRDGSMLSAYFTTILGSQADREAMIAVAHECRS